MSAPCVECRFVPCQLPEAIARRKSIYPREPPRNSCVILLCSTNLTPETLDAIRGQPFKVFKNRKDSVGHIDRPADCSEAKQHRQVYQMAVFPMPNASSGFYLLPLCANPRDPGTVCRGGSTIGRSPVTRGDLTLSTRIRAHAQHKYIRMQ